MDNKKGFELGTINLRTLCAYLAFYMAIVYVFFWEYRFVVHSWLWILFVGIFSFLSIITSRKVYFSKSSICLLLFLLINILGLPFTSATTFNSLKWCMSLFAASLLSILISQGIIDIKRSLHLFLFLSVFFVLGVYLNVISPTIVSNINIITLKSGSYSSFVELNSYKFYSGFSGFTFISGFFSGMASVFFLSYSITCKSTKRVLFIVLGIIAFAAAVFTQKRSIVIGVPLAISIIIITHYSYKKAVKSLLGILLLIVILIVSGYLILTKTAPGQLMLKRFLESEDISSGRIKIYKMLLENWEQYFFIGNGPASTYANIGMEGHNVFLQVFYETGFLGLIIIVLFFIHSFIYSFKALKIAYVNNMAPKTLVISSFGIQIVFFVYCFFGNAFTDFFLFFIFIIFSSITAGITIKWNNKSVSENEIAKKI